MVPALIAMLTAATASFVPAATPIHTNADGRQARTTHILSFVDDYL